MTLYSSDEGELCKFGHDRGAPGNFFPDRAYDPVTQIYQAAVLAEPHVETTLNVPGILHSDVHPGPTSFLMIGSFEFVVYRYRRL